MKKKMVILSLFILLTANAQILNNFGIKTGGTLNHQDWSYTIPGVTFNPEDVLGFNIGVFGEFFEVSNFELVGEINYIQRNVEKEVSVTTIQNPDGDGTTITWYLNIHYLNFSALVKAKIDIGLLTPYFIAGPAYNYELSKSTEDKANFYNDFKKNQFSIRFGAGSEIHLGIVNLLAEFIYTQNLTSIYKNENVEVKTHSFDFRVGIML
jgi:Outer membrane protein beta-barrel domain